MKKDFRIWTALAILFCSMLTGCSGLPEPGNMESTQAAATPIVIAATNTPTPIQFKEPEFSEVSGEGVCLLPALSGEYEPIWDMTSAIPIDQVVKGKGKMEAEYKLLWSKNTLYVQVFVKDETKDTEAKSITNHDSVIFYLNEDGKKNKQYAVGDAYYVVDRDNLQVFGTGCDPSRFQSVTYEVEGGYYVEAAIPLLTVIAEPGREIGFDIRVNDCSKKKLVYALQWSDKSSHTDVNLHGVGILVLE